MSDGFANSSKGRYTATMASTTIIPITGQKNGSKTVIVSLWSNKMAAITEIMIMYLPLSGKFTEHHIGRSKSKSWRRRRQSATALSTLRKGNYAGDRPPESPKAPLQSARVRLSPLPQSSRSERCPQIANTLRFLRLKVSVFDAAF